MIPASPRRVLVTGVALLGMGLVAVPSLTVIQHRGGAAAPGTPGFLRSALGAATHAAGWQRSPAPGIRVSVGNAGTVVHARGGGVSLLAAGVGSAQWQGFAGGAARPTPFGSETVVVRSTSAEESLTVASHHGAHTWRWKLDTGGAVARVTSDGTVSFVRAPRVLPVAVLPVRILDADGRDVTPAGLRWSVETSEGDTWLELRLDDRSLPVPYTIDPSITYSASATAANASAPTSPSTLTVNVPAGTGAGDTLVAQVAFNGGTNTTITAPSGWTLIRKTTNSTNDGESSYYHVATASEPASYSWTVTSSSTPRAAGAILDYAGVDGTGPVDVSSTNTGSSASVQATAVTTTAANDVVVGLYATDTGTSFTKPSAMTERTDVRNTSTSGPSAESADMTQASAASTGTQTATAGSSSNYAAQLVALSLDTTAPTGSLTAPTASSKIRGTVTMTASSADAESGVASVAYQRATSGGSSWTTIGTSTTSPYDLSWNTTGTTDGLYDLRVVTTDNAGNTTTSATVSSVRIDNTVPTGSLTAPTANANVKGSITVSSNSADSGSGVASAALQESPSGAGTWTTITTDTTSPYSTSWATTGVADGLYDLRVVTTDNAGNQTTSATVTVKVDNTSPANGLALSSVSPAGSASISGNTVYYRGSAAGSFQITNTVSDAGSGPASSAFPGLGGTSTGWTHTAQTVSTPSGGPYVTTNSFSWTSGATSTPTEAVQSADAAGNTATTTLTFTNDSTAPTGSVTAPTASAIVRGSTTVSSNSADAGSGVASAAFQRSPAGAGTWTTIATATTSPYQVSWNTTGVTDGLYDLRVVTTDNDGNSTTSATISNVRVDNTAPTGSLTAPAASANERGTVTVSANSADAGSGVASAAFQESPTGAGTWSTISTDTTSPYSATWDTTGVADGQYDLRVVTTDNAGNATTSATVTVRVDNTAPSGSVTSPAAGASIRGAVTVVSNAADGGSGVASAAIQRSPAGAGTWTTIGTASSSPYQVSWATTGVSDGLYDLRVVTTDNAGNSTTSATVSNVRVDNTAPTGSVTSPAAGANVRGTVTVVTNAADGGSGLASAVIQRSPAGAGTWTTISTVTGSPYQASWDTTGVTDGLYDLRVVTTDNAGNSTTSATVSNVRVDNTAPTGSVTSPAASANVRGTVTVVSSAADGGSGVASAAIQRSPAGAGTWTTIGTATGSPYQVSWDTTGVTDGLYDLRAVTTDNAGNSTTSATVSNVRVDNTAPTGSVTSPAASANVRGAVTVSSNAADGGSGVASAAIQRSPAGAGTWTTIGTATGSPYQVSWDTTGVTDGLYDLRVVTTDAAGNSTTSATASNVRVDNTAPSTSITSPSGGANLHGTVSVVSLSSDGGSGIASAVFQRSSAGAGTWTTISTVIGSPYQASWDTTGVADGLYDLRVVTTDNAGTSTTSATVSSVRVDNTAPTGSVTSPAASANVHGTVTVVTNAADGGSGVATAAVQRSPAGAGTWTTIGTAAGSPYQVSWDTTGIADGLYDLRVVTTDNVGNATTSATIANVRVDNTAPTGTLTNPGTPVKGTITLSSSSSDGGSGVASAVFQRSPAGAGTWTTISTVTGSPYQASWATTGVSDGVYDLRVVTTDNAGNSTTSPTIANVRVDNTPPTGSVTSPAAAANVRGTVTVTTSAADGGSGVASAVIQRSPAGAGTWTTISTVTGSPYQASWDTTGVADGLYDLRVVTTDAAGNSTTSATVGSVRVDNTAPTGSVTSPAASANVRGTVMVSTNAADGGSGVASAALQRSPAGAGTWTTIGTATGSPYQASWDTTGVADGLYDLRVVTTDAAGNSTTSPTVSNVRVDNTAPTGSVTSPAASASVRGTVTVATNAADGGSGVASAVIQRSPAGAGTWTTIGTATGSPYQVSWVTTGVSDGLYDLRVVTTDVAGNSTTSATVGNVRVDNTAPTGSVTSPAASTNVRGTVTVATNAADGGSGVASAAIQRSPAGAGTWTTIGTATGSPYQASWDTTAVSDGLYDLRVVTTDNAGNSTTSAAVTNVRVDNTAPTGSVTSPAAGANIRGTVTVTTNAADGGSGVASAALQRSPAGAGTWTTIGTATGSPYQASWDTTGVADGVYDLRVVTTDAVGNSTTSATVSNVRVDNTAPTGSITSPAAGATFHGSVSLVALASDAGSGISGVVFQRSPAGAGTWTAIGTATGSPYQVNWDTTGVSDGLYDLRSVVTDNAGNSTTSATVANVRVDNTAPTGSVTSPSAGTNIHGAVTVATNAADGGSGVASAVVQSSPAGAGTWTTIGTATGSPYQVSWDTTGIADGLYDLRVVVTDNVGNSSTSASISNVRVDNTAPTGTLTNPGSPVKGTITLAASSSDAGSGVASAVFQRSPAGAGTWTTISTVTGAPYQTSWDTTAVADGLYDLRVVTTDNAGNAATSPTVSSILVDNTAPTGSVTSPATSANLRGTVTVATNAADGGSGVASAVIQRSPAGAGTWTTIDTATGSPFQASWDTTGVSDGLYDLRVVTTDAAGNSTTSATVDSVRVDNTAPTGSVTSPAAGANVRGTVTVAANAADGGSGVASAVIQRSPAGAGAWTTIGTATGSPYEASWDTTGVSDGLYDLRVVTTDGAGNSAASATIGNILVDNTSPTGSIAAPAASASIRGVVNVVTDAADAGSGVASAVIQRSPAGAGTWTTIGTATGSPYQANWDTTGVADGLYDLRVVTTDSAGNTTTSAAVANVRVDNTAPSGSLANPGSPLKGMVTLSASSSDGGSGVASSVFQASPAGAGTWATIGTATGSPYQVGWDTTGVSDGLYDLRVVTTDNAGNSTTSAQVGNVRVDNTAPTGSVTSPAAGASVRGTITVATNAADAGSGVASAVIQRSPAGAGTWTTISTATGSPYQASWDTTGVADGLYDLRVVTTDYAGNSTTSATVSNLRVDNTAPTGTLTDPGSPLKGTVVLGVSSSDSGSGVASAAFQSSPAGAGTWTTIGTATGSPYQLSWDTSGVSDGLYDLRVVTTDNAGNSTTSATVAGVRVDNTAPTGSIATPSPDTNIRGTVTVSASSADGGSGVASAVLQRSPAGAGAWTTIGTASSSPYQASWDTTAVPDGLYDLRVITTDVAGNSTTSAVAANVRVDNTPPGGGSVSYQDGWDDSGSVTVTTNAGSDSGSGLATGTAVLERDSALLSGGNCGAFANSWVTVTSPDSTVADGACYRYRYRVFDAAGNTATYTSSSVVEEDSSAPTGTLADPGSILTGVVPLSATAADSLSGVSSVAFQRSPAGAGTWTTISTDMSSPYSAMWNTSAAADGQYDLRVLVTDVAGNTAASSIVTGVLVDNTAPAGAITTPLAGADVAGTLTVASNSADAGSGVTSVIFQRAVSGHATWTTIGTATAAPYQVSWDTSSIPDGSYDLRAITFDAAGNSTTSATVAGVLVDNTPPGGGSISYENGWDRSGIVAVTTDPGSDAGSGIDSGSGVIERDSAALSGSNCGAFANHWVAVSAPDMSVVSGACYRYRYSVSDAAGNTVTYTSSSVVKEDTAAPASSLTNPGADVRGSVTLHATAGDALSGVASVTFQESPAGGGSWTTVATASSSPYQATWDTTALADGSYDLRLVTTDVAGNSGTSATVAVLVDNTAPTGSVTAPAAGADLAGMVAVTTDAADSGSGVASAAVQRSPAGAGTWTTIGTATSTPHQVTWDTTGVADGLYDLRVVTTDNSGNSTTSAAVAGVQVDNTAPTVTMTDPGAVMSGTVTLSSTPADSGSGVAMVTYERLRLPSGHWTTIGTSGSAPFSLDFDSTTVPDGIYQFRAVASDNAGNSTTSPVITPITVDNTPADVSIASPADGDFIGSASADPATITATTTDSTVQSVEFFVCSDTSAGCSGGTWTSLGDGTGGPYTYSIDWPLPADDGPRAIKAVSTDNAGNHGSDVATVTIDRQAPAGGDVSYPNGYVSGAVTVTTDPGTDDGAGIDFATGVIERDAAVLSDGVCGAWSGSWSAVTSPDSTVSDGHCYRYRYSVADLAGNVVTYTSPNVVSVDTAAPAASLSAPADVSGTVTLSGSVSDPGGSGLVSVAYQIAPAGSGSWSPIGTATSDPWSVGFDTTGYPDGAYDLRAVATDGAGNSTTSAVVPGIVVDNTLPAVGLTAPANNAQVTGTIPVSADASDAGSGIDSVTFLARRGSTGAWTPFATDTAAPFTASWDSTTVADGSAQIEVVAHDAAGNTSFTVHTVKVDNTAPTVSLHPIAANVRGSVGLLAYPAPDTATVAFQVEPQGGSWTTVGTSTASPFRATLNTATLADGTYLVRAVATDRDGHVSMTAGASTLVDNTLPAGTLSVPAGGPTFVTNPVVFDTAASDATSGVASVTYQIDPPGGLDFSTVATLTAAPYTYDWTRTGLPLGAYRVRAIVTDNAGNQFVTPVSTVTLGAAPPKPLTFSLGKAKLSQKGANDYISLTPKASRAATFTVTLSKGKKKVKAWKVKFKAGKHPVKLVIPARLFKKGTYVLTFTARSAGRTVKHSITVKRPAKLPKAK